MAALAALLDKSSVHQSNLPEQGPGKSVWVVGLCATCQPTAPPAPTLRQVADWSATHGSSSRGVV